MGIRLLIVDSQPLIRSGVAELLRRAPDISVIGQAASAREAVRLACAERPDVVVIEPFTPDDDGVEAIRTIHARCPGANVLVLTQREDPEEAVRALEAGAVGYVLKDIEPEHLLSAVRRVASGQAMLNPRIARHLVARLGSGNGAGPPSPRASGLTEREVEILRLVASGLSDREIGKRLFLSEATVKTHLKATYRKLRVRNRAQAAVLAALAGLLSPPSVPPASSAEADEGRRR
ncbi:MAG: response regulator transcription factor [Armatimonadota bacterium]|nr:response regulator transcription factor [Armatimonadota bacterium]